MSITITEVVNGNHFTISNNRDEHYCYRVSCGERRGRLPATLFVHYVWTDGSAYIGKLDRKTGAVTVTPKSAYPETDYRVALANRVLQAVYGGRQAIIEQHGFSIRPGTPNDQHEETAKPTPIAETSCNRATVDVGEVVMIQYDIPEVKTTVNGAVESNPVYPNPSAILRKAGVRWTKSVWMFQETRCPWVLIDQMIAAGCTVDVVPVADKATEQILKIAQQRLTAELKDGLVSLEESAKTAEANYQKNLDEGMGADKAIVAYQRHMAAAAKRCETLSKDLEGVAKNFGVTLTREEIAAAIRSTMTRATDKAASYARAAKELQGTVYAQAAQEGDLPAAVIVDILRDRDNDEVANDLAGCFDLETGAPIN